MLLRQQLAACVTPLCSRPSPAFSPPSAPTGNHPLVVAATHNYCSRSQLTAGQRHSRSVQFRASTQQPPHQLRSPSSLTSTSATKPSPSMASSATPTIKPFAIVVATTQRGGIGKDGQLPWPKLKADMKFFAQITSTVPTTYSAKPVEEEEKQQPHTEAAPAQLTQQHNAVIMGRKTWDSLPAAYKPLPNRINIILTRNKEAVQQQVQALNAKLPVHVASTLDEALQLCNTDPQIAAIHVIGGGEIYQQALQHPQLHTIYQTLVLKDFDTDTSMAPIDQQLFELSETQPLVVENDVPYQIQTYKRRHEEHQYLDLVKRVIAYGNVRTDRTGTGTRSLFGQQMRYSLRNGTFPLLTTKRVFWRGVVEELLWLIRGQTDSKTLAAKKVHIWDDNGSRDFLDKLGFKNREVGDLGPVYGHQWRHFGASYKDCHTDYTGQGVDQLQRIIELIRTNPTDRRLVMNAWNAADLSQMALPPCHVMAQFYVSGEDELSCLMYQRSADLGLGVPFNIASYSLLTIIIAHMTGKKPGEFVHVLGDAHVYLNHVEPLKQQLQRTPNAFPTLRIKRTDVPQRIDDYQFEDFEIVGYKPLEAIKMQMAV